jgi:hypothetical protein
MVSVPGLPGCDVHVPVLVAAIVADPPGSMAQVTYWLGPALATGTTWMDIVSAHGFAVQTNLYTPVSMKFEIDV